MPYNNINPDLQT